LAARLVVTRISIRIATGQHRIKIDTGLGRRSVFLIRNARFNLGATALLASIVIAIRSARRIGRHTDLQDRLVDLQTTHRIASTRSLRRSLVSETRIVLGRTIISVTAVIIVDGPRNVHAFDIDAGLERGHQPSRLRAQLTGATLRAGVKRRFTRRTVVARSDTGITFTTCEPTLRRGLGSSRFKASVVVIGTRILQTRTVGGRIDDRARVAMDLTTLNQ
jgi:hypothetical protein